MRSPATLARRIAAPAAAVGIAALVALAALLSPPSASPALGAPEALPPPPPGGLTQGIAGTNDPAALVAAQTFDVAVVWVLDPETQRWLVYVPGAPEGVNTLTRSTLDPDDVVSLRREGPPPRTQPQTVSAPPSVEPAGDGNELDTPPPGGFTQGAAGTNDPARLVEQQRFPVASVSVLDVASQAWLVYLPGAPPAVNTLQPGILRPDSIVTVRREPPVAIPPATPYTVDEAAEREMLARLNDARTAAGLPALGSDPALVAIARAHSLDMWERDFFGHENPDGLDPFERMQAAGISYRWGGENLVKAQTVQEAHDLLMNSDGHRENILREQFGHVGIGCVRNGDWLNCTQSFKD